MNVKKVVPAYSGDGYWWSPERRMLQNRIDRTQRSLNGTVRMKLYRGLYRGTVDVKRGQV